MSCSQPHVGSTWVVRPWTRTYVHQCVYLSFCSNTKVMLKLMHGEFEAMHACKYTAKNCGKPSRSGTGFPPLRKIAHARTLRHDPLFRKCLQSAYGLQPADIYLKNSISNICMHRNDKPFQSSDPIRMPRNLHTWYSSPRSTVPDSHDVGYSNQPMVVAVCEPQDAASHSSADQRSLPHHEIDLMLVETNLGLRERQRRQTTPLSRSMAPFFSKWTPQGRVSIT
jgi:hypothetical protein